MSHYRIAFNLLCAVLVVGCSNSIKVSGTVVFDDDQSPLTVGTVLLQSNTHVAKGQIDSAGHFRISSVNNDDGVPPDVYRVAVLGAVKMLERGINESTGMPVSREPILLIQSKYMDPKTSGITFDTSKDKVLNIVVERASPK